MPGPTLGSIAEGAAGQQLDLQQIQMNQFKLAEAPIQLQTEQIQLQRDKMALGRELMIYKLAQQRYGAGHPANEGAQQAGGLAGGAGGAGLAGDLMWWAQTEMDLGAPDQASKLATAASRLQESQSRTDYRNYRVQSEQISRFTDMLDTLPNDPKGWEYIRAQMNQDPQMIRNPTWQRISQMPWDPNLFNRLKAGANTQKEQADIQYKQKLMDRANSQMALDDLSGELKKAQTQLARDRDAALGKAGGVKGPPTQLIKAVHEYSERRYPAVLPGVLEVPDRQVAEDAQRLMIANPNLRQSEAAAIAFQNAQAAGMYIGIREGPDAPGSVAGAALPLPTNLANARQLREGMWYKDPDKKYFPQAGGQPFVVIGGKGYTQADLARRGRAGPPASSEPPPMLARPGDPAFKEQFGPTTDAGARGKAPETKTPSRTATDADKARERQLDREAMGFGDTDEDEEDADTVEDEGLE
jgi:hypothetical protein